MSEFVVSARKYRPTRFDDVVGQSHVSETLKNALRQNRLAHAFLFCGPRGVGKTTNARILAKVLNCLNVSDDFEPCNTCSNCVAFNQNASFNIFELDGASNNKVESMHQLMEQVRIPPQTGRKKVYIIDEVHMLSSAAFNAFLKTLEEPPDYAIFILATTEKHKILPTILSRCQVYDFHRIRPADMVAHLRKICTEEDIATEDEALHLVAEKADGALRDALSIFDRLVSSSRDSTLTYAHAATQLNVLDHATFFEVTDALLREDVGQLYLTFDEVLRNGFEPEPFLGGLAQHLRQLFVCKSPQTLKLLEVSDSLRQRYAAQASLCGLPFLVNALNLAAECDFRLRLAAQKRLHVELYLVKMAYAARTVAREYVASGQLPVDSSQFSLPVQGAQAPGGNAGEGRAAASAKTVGAPVDAGASGQLASPVAFAPAQALPAAPTTPVAVVAATVAAPLATALEEPTTTEAPQPAAPQSASPVQPLEDAPAPHTPHKAPRTAQRSAVLAAAALPSISFDDDDDGPVAVARVTAKSLTIKQLQAEWLALAEGQPQRIRTVMRRAKLHYSCPELIVRVGSLLALNILKTEAQNIRDIKQTLHCDELDILYDYDESLAPVEEVKVKPAGPREQYQLLMGINPEVDSLRKRLGLKYEG